MQRVLINGVPNLFLMSKDEKNAFFKDPTLIAEILERKQNKQKKTTAQSLNKQAIVR